MTPQDVRAIALALPEAHEADHFGSPSFRVGKKIFATLGETAGRVTLKLDPEDRHNLAEAHPGAIEAVPGYWGRSGWTLADYAALDEATIASLLKLAWAAVAPKRLLMAV
jgi:hypothetical protein